MNGKEAYDKIFDKLTYDQQQELGEQVLRIVYQDLNRLENLEKAIEILNDKLELTLYHNKILNTYSIELMCFEEHLGKYITQEEYELLKELLGNKWYNKPLPAFAPKEEYDYSFVNDCFQKAEKYDCDGFEKEVKRYSEEKFENE